MQNTKDTFLIALRDRLTVLNPNRTCVVRGAVRPAVLCVENELLDAGEGPTETFVLQWTAAVADSSEAVALDSLSCEITYTTEGSDLAAGMDRGRVLDAMDGELRTILLPAMAVKQDYATNPPTTLSTNVFWSDVAMGAAVLSQSAVSRVATVTVYGLREAGER